MKRAKVIAYYLPQFHPIKENDEWWGQGYTEWTTVAKAKPLFKGHDQPHVPADLGFYDLRLAESRDLQAELAKQAGIDAFCYWHYWFGNGEQLLEKPLQLVVETGHPDFPFCLGWANHSWKKKNWNAETSILDQTLLMEMTYPGADDFKAHFYKMLPMFKDRRYYKIAGKLLFLIYDFSSVPLLDLFMSLWQKLAKEHGLPPFCFLCIVRNIEEIRKAENFAFDYLVWENHHHVLSSGSINKNRIRNILGAFIKHPLNVMYYSEFIKKLDYQVVIDNEKILPTIFPNWDTSPRRGYGGTILRNASPSLFREHVENVLNVISRKSEENRILFLKSWNEWGEGNYMEPDIQYGQQRIKMLREALYK